MDENFDCPEVIDRLDRAGVRYRIYKQDVQGNAGSADVAFLPTVGEHGWLLITGDWHQRNRPREAADLQRYGVKHFALPGNMSATAMADLLIAAKNDIIACARGHVGHVSANITRQCAVNVIRDSQGSLHDRGIRKTYYRGRVTFSKPQ